jgi:hypothetical protein
MLKGIQTEGSEKGDLLWNPPKLISLLSNNGILSRMIVCVVVRPRDRLTAEDINMLRLESRLVNDSGAI